MSAGELLQSLQRAVEVAPDDVSLRLHLAELLAADGQWSEAVRHAAAVLLRDPENRGAMHLLSQRESRQSEPEPPAEAVQTDWTSLRELDAQLSDVAPPMFVDGPEALPFIDEPERSTIRLDDVGGMAEVKARLEAAILAPLRNPELVKLYGKSLKGGLLLYGPPGCGKTFIARAVAGEMGAHFVAVSLADVLDMYIGQSERNLHEVFATARANAPCVVFLDEIDALGLKRSQMRHSAARGTVNQLLTEMDGMTPGNDGVYVLGATNHPWDVDVALRRPGRFDRMVAVLPPDLPARVAIFRFHLVDRPIANIDLARLAEMTDGYSGADIAYVCESAAERALLDSARTGSTRMIDMVDLEHAARDVRPSIGPWLDTARNVAQFANENGAYDDLLDYLRRRRML